MNDTATTNAPVRRARVHELYTNPMSGAMIEARSFEIIDALAEGTGVSAEAWPVMRRMIHTVGDVSLLPHIRISPDAIAAGVAALRAASPFYLDANMIRAGISQARLQRVNAGYGPDHLKCHIADPDVAYLAEKQGLPRSLFAVRKAEKILSGGIAVFGNAPVGLLELNRMILEEGIRPALVIGLPVGFVHVVESKSELMTLGAPYIVIEGQRGGSPLAVSVVHALCELACGR